MLELCQEHNQRVMNPNYRKRREHLTTYKSGGNENQIDYVLNWVKETKNWKMKNYKVIPGEACLTQHRLLWAEVVIRGRKKRVSKRGEKKIKAWKPKDRIKRRMAEERMSDRIGANVDHAALSNALLNSAREVCGEIAGRRQRNVVV